jgi:hypothetical protein
MSSIGIGWIIVENFSGYIITLLNKGGQNGGKKETKAIKVFNINQKRGRNKTEKITNY